LPSDLLTPIFVPEAVQAAVSGEAWLQALLDTEAALARAEARAGLIPAEAAAAIGEACRAERFDVGALALDGRRVGNPAEPVARALAEAAGDAGRYVHKGATSQDVVDTAASLVARRTLELVLADLDAVAAACASLAERHRSMPIAGRTLLQHALPTTFGLKAAGWLVGVLDARAQLVAARERLAVELGGAAGTLASLGDRGLDVLRLFAEELDLGEPVVPWHTARARTAELGAALDLTAGTLAKIGLDVVLLAQTEIAEVREPAGEGRGGSSTLPHKRNPIGSTLTRACATGVHAAAGVLSAALSQEHERAAGAWHAEWRALSDALALTGGAASWMREVLEGLEVDEARMRENLGATAGLLMAERVSGLLAESLGRVAAHDLVQEAAKSGGSFRAALLSDRRVAEHLSEQQIDEALDPAGYLGSAETLVDRALAHYREVTA
jgi:3-carboxy-cis,cis-muconate cycloisomerase